MYNACARKKHKLYQRENFDTNGVLPAYNIVILIVIWTQKMYISPVSLNVSIYMISKIKVFQSFWYYFGYKNVTADVTWQYNNYCFIKRHKGMDSSSNFCYLTQKSN